MFHFILTQREKNDEEWSSNFLKDQTNGFISISFIINTVQHINKVDKFLKFVIHIDDLFN